MCHRTIVNELQRWDNEQGFSLIEILVTITLIGIIAVSVLSLFSIGVARQRRLVNETTAIYFAQQGIEQVLADRQQMGFETVTNGRYPTQIRDGIERSIRIRSATIDRKQITVVVKWSKFSDSLTTEIARY